MTITQINGYLLMGTADDRQGQATGLYQLSTVPSTTLLTHCAPLTAAQRQSPALKNMCMQLDMQEPRILLPRGGLLPRVDNGVFSRAANLPSMFAPPYS